ncbi:MAG: hypothetical protein KAX40_00365 [Herpetosiphon sp.]|nr:hypothetical protein [Herpetosiphon sp.]
MAVLEYIVHVADDGSIQVQGLEPRTAVKIIIQPIALNDWKHELDAIFADVRKHHPFTTMSHEDVLAVLRQTREVVAEEQYGHLP